MNRYIESHLARGDYLPTEEGDRTYQNILGWTDYRIGDHIIFAHRTTDHNAQNFRDTLHTHEYCEVVFWLSGDVQYISGDRTEDPKPGSIIVIPPGGLHSTRLLHASRYDRYVLYVSKDAFSSFGGALGDLLVSGSSTFAGVASPELNERAMKLLRDLEGCLEAGGENAELTAFSCVIELLLAVETVCAGNHASPRENKPKLLPKPVRAIRGYIEEHYSTISSVEEVATQFYYSREYVSRLFRRYYNVSPGEYIERCRVREAERRIAAGERITEVCYAVGYRSMSAFSAAVRRVTGKAPSAFRGDRGNVHK